MKLLIILSSFIIAQAAVLKDDSTVIKINGDCYEKEILNNVARAVQLRVDHSSNTLYFSHYESESSTTRAAKYDLNTQELTHIEGISRGYAQAVDPKTHDVYLGADDGIFKYNKNTKKAEFLGEKGSNIWGMYYKDTLYFTLFTSERVYTYTDGKATIVEELKDTSVHQFIIDDDDEMFYSNNTGVYGQKKGTNDVVLYKKLGDDVVRQLSVDLNGDVYAVFGSGIYGVDKTTKTLVNLFKRDYSMGLAFDSNNNIIYSDWSNLFRLKSSAGLICPEASKQQKRGEPPYVAPNYFPPKYE